MPLPMDLDRHRSTSPQDRQGRRALLHHPRHPIPRSRDADGAPEGGARGQGQDHSEGV